MFTKSLFLYFTLILLIALALQASAETDFLDDGQQLGDHAPPMLTYLTAAVKQGAACLDGSPPAYQFQKGVRRGINNWIVFLEGGALCYDTKTCFNRSQSELGSSNKMTPKQFTGVISNNQHINPNFHDWNRVFVRYCDGGLYTGNRYDAVHKLHYKGVKILKAVTKDLLDKGMIHATNVVLHGCSAGGQGAILNCDRFRSFLPTRTNVKCVSDAGYFVHVKDVLGEYNFVKSYIEGCAKLHGSIKNLPKACTSTMKPKSLCLYPQYVIAHIKTPIFIINSALDRTQIGYVFAPPVKKLPHSWRRCRDDFRKCSSEQIEILKGYRQAFLHALPSVGNGTSRGMYVTSCDLHCRDDLEPNQNWSNKMKIEQKELIKALGNWTVTGSPYQKVDDTDVPQVCVKPSV